MMSTTMRAAVLHDIKDLRVEDFPKPTNLGPDDVLVHVKYNGLCGTDASEYAKKIGAQFYETSSKDGTGINGLFQSIAERLHL